MKEADILKANNIVKKDKEKRKDALLELLALYLYGLLISFEISQINVLYLCIF